MKLPIRIRVPASSANLGSGFDTVGLALSLYNFFDVLEELPEGEYSVDIIGEGSRELARDIEKGKTFFLHGNRNRVPVHKLNARTRENIATLFVCDPIRRGQLHSLLGTFERT